MFSSSRTDIDVQGGRSMVLGRGGMVCSSQPLASLAGVEVLRSGGNAVDAAVCAAATLGVVEPFMTGIGGDCFMLIWNAEEERLFALNGSGRAPRGASVQALAERGIGDMPMLGIHAVTVPGALAAWNTAVERFGSQPLSRLLAPAIDYARNGFPVTEIIAYQWELAAALLQEEEAQRVFLADGRVPVAGDVVRLADLAEALEKIAVGGPDELYRGDLARRIAEASAQRGGLLDYDDLAAHRSSWVEPLSVDYRGFRLCETPPNGQGIAALIALNILECFDLGRNPRSAEAAHLLIEAVKLAYADRDRYVADPEHADVPIGELLSKDYAQGRAAMIDLRKTIKAPAAGRLPVGADTVYLCTADGAGNFVSLINSLFFPFGSGVVPEGTGIALQNRGYGFSLDPDHPNCIAPGKRPFHTIIPAILLRDGIPCATFGVMGGDMQAQGHVQIVSHLVDEGCTMQAAIDAPRFHFLEADRVALEPGLEARVGAQLRKLGHDTRDPSAALGHGGFGGAQGIAVDRASGVLWGASDPRKDGCAIGF
jgi:gamma-glutamyltranspeptidase/glutathione hydrolase